MVWVVRPSLGDYGLSSDAAAGTVAVLRPVRVTFEVRPSPRHPQVDRTMAATQVPLRILVRAATGVGDPGPIALSFRTCGDAIPQPAGAPPAYRWMTEPSGPSPGAVTVTPEGRIYDIVAEFRVHPETPGSIYIGYLELTAQRGEAVVGTYAHRVEVHPLLAVSPMPLTAYASDKALGRHDRACTQFSFLLDAGQLPHPERPQYPFRVALVAPDPKVLDLELNQAAVTLDGLPLQVGKPGTDPGPWLKGRSLSPGDFLRKHEVCVRIGKPVRGDPAKPVELKLATTLVENPYDDFGVVQPFTLKVPIAPLSFFQRWKPALLSGLAVLGALVLVWFLRDIPAVPDDLRYTVQREDSTAEFTARTFGEPPASAQLLGWVAERAVIAPGESRPLGHVRPVHAELFQLRPARGVRVESLDRGETIPRRRGLSTLAVQRTYRLRTDHASYLFRLEYA
jgi:hypothetical protein